MHVFVLPEPLLRKEVSVAGAVPEPPHAVAVSPNGKPIPHPPIVAPDGVNKAVLVMTVPAPPLCPSATLGKSDGVAIQVTTDLVSAQDQPVSSVDGAEKAPDTFPALTPLHHTRSLNRDAEVGQAAGAAAPFYRFVSPAQHSSLEYIPRCRAVVLAGSTGALPGATLERAEPVRCTRDLSFARAEVS